MKKFKVFFCLLLLVIGTNIGLEVKAVDELPDNGGRVSSAAIIQNKTGTGPWDLDDNPGNDSSDDNNIVRSFDQVTWTIENTMVLTGNEASSYTGGKLYFEATIPSVFESGQAGWNLGSMAWIENPKLSADKLTVSGYYSLPTENITIPGKQSVNFVLDVYGAPNGVKFTPTFKFWLSGNSEADYYVIEGNEITVSAAPNYNIKLIRNNNCENRTIFNVDGREVEGRIYGYALLYQLYNTSVSKGLKGIEYPAGDITFDLNMNLTKKPANSSTETDISNEVTPILWNYQLAGAGINNTKIAGRNMYAGTSSFVYNGNNLFPAGKLGNAINSAYNSGDILMVQNGTKISTTLSNYKFNGVFPKHNIGYSSNSAISYSENIGVFGSIYFQIIVPDWDEFDSITDYYLTVNDTNFRAVSISGIETTTQKITNDDSNRAQYVRTKPGSYNSLVYIRKRNGASDTGMLHSYWNYGDGRVQAGQELWLRSEIEQGVTNDEEAHMRAVNDFYKFDADCYEPVVVNGAKYRTANNKMQWNMWYVTKKDGTNWTSQEEMNTAIIEDCDIYENLEDIPDGKLCIGVYYESKEGGELPDRDYWIDVPVTIKSTTAIGQTYGITSGIKYWKNEIDRSVYTIANVIADENIEWPEGTVFDTVKNVRNYVKTEYTPEGVQISGTHSGGTYYGNTVQVIGAQQKLSIKAIVKGTDTSKINYDISKNEYDVTYKMTPVISSSYAAQTIDGISVELVATLPAGVTYNPGTSSLGEPEIINNVNGTTSLKWNIQGCAVNQQIEPVLFDAHISEDTPNGTQYEVSALMLADTEKVGNTKIEDRTATTTIQIINLSSHRLYKSVTTPVIEKNGQIHYSIAYKNNTDENIPDFQLLDILPYNGDSRGTDYSGTYKLAKLVVTQKDGNGSVIANGNLDIRYTEDEGVRTTVTSKDSNLANDWTQVTSENIQKAATAYAIKGQIGGQGSLVVDIYLDTLDNTGLDKYVNNASAQIYSTTEELVTGSVTSQVVKRTIEGIAWDDANANGIKDANEQVFKNVEMTLVDNMGRQVRDVDGNALESVKTNDSGYYKFTNLPRGNYYVRVVEPNAKYTLTEKEVGNNSAVNSKFKVYEKETDIITKLDSIDLPELTVSNENAGFVKKPTKVIVNYLEEGTLTKLSDEITINGRVDDNYSTVNKLDEINAANGNKYEYTRIDGNATGTMTANTIYVTYYYQKKPAEIEVLYKEIGTETELANKEASVSKVDDTYTTTNKLNEINAANGNKYEFVRIDGNATGTYTVEKQTITYWYQKKIAEIEVNYLELGTNTVLSEQVKKQDRIDNPYTTENKLDEINANHGNKYEFVRVDGNATGNYTVNKQVITYYYQKKNTKVVVLHVLEGTDVSNPANVTDVLYPTQNVTGRVDDTYTTQNKLAEINRSATLEYEYVGSTNNTSGTMTVDTIYVIYTYKTISAKVIVNHLEKDTDVVLNPQEVKNGFVGNNYETSNKLNEINQANGNKYELVTPEPSNKNGKYTREDIVVNYYYQKKIARIEVNYLEVGTNNALSTQEVKQDRIDASYTTENRLDEINQRYNNQYEFVRVDGNANGNYTLDTQVITYWYQKKAAEIEVQYREVGTEEELAEKVEKTSRVGDAYTTEDKLDEINTNHGNKYEFVRIVGEEEGTYKLEKQTIIYYYQKKLADLEVNYLELETNKVLSEQILGQERVDTPYTTENKLDQINRVWENKYEFVRVDGNATGNYTVDKQVVTYYYQKKPAEIEVQYREVGTEIELADKVEKTAKVDDEYTTENKLNEINEANENKYEFVRVDGNANGTYTADKQVITYWYQKKPAEIEVLYKEIGTEKELATKVEKAAKVDDEYTTENKLNEINASNQDKYEFVRVDGNESGTYTLEKQTITYWYQKKMAEVEVNYLEVDTDKVLSNQVNMSDRIDNPYTTENKLDSINQNYENKYEFVRVEGNPEGNYTLQKQVITYYYQKKMAEIEVNYLEVGTNTVLSEQIKKQDRIDNPYTTENKLDEINEEYDNKYEFVRVEGNPEGNYTLDKQVITYYYQKKMAEVEVNYLEVDTDKVLSDQVNMTDRIDNPYTTENKLDEINEEYGNKYEFVRVEGNPEGTYTLEKQTIIYYYQKKMAEVEVNYLEVGTNAVLSEQLHMTDRIDNPYSTENKLNSINENYENKYEFVRVDGNENGTYTLDKQVITYWYQKKPAEIEVQYREVGTEEELAEKVEKSARIDDSYTTENKLDEINSEYGNKYEFVRVEGNPEGTYTLEKQTIIYYYQKKMAEVEVNYLEVGTNAVLSEQVYMTDRIDNPYVTENKLNEINAANGNKYEFVRVDGNVSGNYTLDKQIITYWYQKKETKVVILHVEQGTDTTDPSTVTSVLYPTETIEGRIDDGYRTNDRVNDINRNSQVQYEVVSKTDNWEGNMTLDTQYVIYVYRKIPAHIVVKHVDVNTKEELLEPETRNGYVGNEYTTENKLAEVNEKHENKYELVTPEPTNKNGVYSSQEQVIIYYYNKKPAQVNVKYVDIDTEEELVDGEEIVGKVDDEYTTEDKVKEINDSSKYKYVLVETTENTEGLMTVEDIEVVYYYKKVEAQVIVKYVDEKTGEEIAQREYIGGYVGDEYTSKSKEIDEYILNEKKLPNNAEGKMTEETIEVIYYYNKMIKIPETADMNVSMILIVMIASISGITLVRKCRRQ